MAKTKGSKASPASTGWNAETGPPIFVRGAPNELRVALEAMAKESRRSVNAEVLTLLEAAVAKWRTAKR